MRASGGATGHDNGMTRGQDWASRSAEGTEESLPIHLKKGQGRLFHVPPGGDHVVRPVSRRLCDLHWLVQVNSGEVGAVSGSGGVTGGGGRFCG